MSVFSATVHALVYKSCAIIFCVFDILWLNLFNVNLEKLKSVGESDLKAMLKLKADECKQSGEEFDGKINMWDLKYKKFLLFISINFSYQLDI